jgi:ribosome-associated heat shock protein Hsp15
LSEQLRIDKWLWHARFCKTRAIAQQKAQQGRIRLNGHRVEKASAAVRVGDVMTLPHLGNVIVLKVLGLGVRRGPAPEAMTLYEIVEDGRRDG